MRTRWAILGPGAISRDFATGVRASRFGELVAVGSSSIERARAFAREHDVVVAGGYDEVLARDDVDAVYVGTVHTLHADLAVRALEAGKGVLCEKPAGVTSAEVERMLSSAARARRPFLEAFKPRFGPFAAALRALIRSGELGAPLRLETAFGFDADAHRKGRLFDPLLGGGAILDAGCYPVSLAVEIAAAAGLNPLPDGVDSIAGAHDGGVDLEASATLRFSAFTADVRTAIVRSLPRSARLVLDNGHVHVNDVWGSRTRSVASFTVRNGAHERTATVPVVQPMAAEADALSSALAEGRLEALEMPWSHTRAIATAIGRWREQVLAL